MADPDTSQAEHVSKVRFKSRLVTAMSLTCHMRRGTTPSYYVERTWIGVPLAGVFTLHARRDDHLVHPALGVIFPRGIEYSMTHPNDDGDTSVAFGFAPELVEEALRTRSEHIRVTSLDLRLRYAVGLLMAAIDRGEDRLVIDEMAIHLLRDVASGVEQAQARSATARSRRRIDRVRQLLAERPEVRWTIEDLARTADYSPFHLARQFRAHTGTTVHQYLADLRAAAALRRIEAGATSLATVAADSGFSHHSHLTATLRRRLGVTPQRIRARLQGSH